MAAVWWRPTYLYVCDGPKSFGHIVYLVVLYLCQIKNYTDWLLSRLLFLKLQVKRARWKIHQCRQIYISKLSKCDLWQTETRTMELVSFPKKRCSSPVDNLSGLIILLLSPCRKWSYKIRRVKRCRWSGFDLIIRSILLSFWSPFQLIYYMNMYIAENDYAEILVSWHSHNVCLAIPWMFVHKCEKQSECK